MANYPKGKNPSDLVLVASADTVISRKTDISGYDLLVVDEAHLAVNGSFKKVIEGFSNYIVSVTATPYGNEPLTHLAEAVVKPITTIELIEKGHLVNAKYFAPNVPDLKGIKIKAGDYAEAELEKTMAPLTGDIIKHWKLLGENRPTLCFAVNIVHSKKIVEAFNSQNIPALHLDAESTLAERDLAVKQLIDGHIKIISNVGIMNTGVDIPPLSCIILARPTKSVILHVQQLGRGTRPYLGKENFIVLDHAGNTIKHGFITQEQEVFLEGKPKKEKDSDISITICKSCYLVFQGKICPACSYDNTSRYRL
jgi:superfamily II DNA or RNA helicase